MKLIDRIKKYIYFNLYPLNPTEKRIANGGERLVPKIALDPEVIRHKSSYAFFKRIIQSDVRGKKKITILDLGCGVGHGCMTLSEIKNASVTGVDISEEAIEYATEKYQKPNIRYFRQDLINYLKTSPEFDYIVSRGVLEHIKGGLELAKKSRFKSRLIFDVPYNENSGPNPYHLITGIKEKNFDIFPRKELFFEDLSGNIYNLKNKPLKPNMIICVASSGKMPPLAQKKMKFPIPAWKGKKI